MRLATIITRGLRSVEVDAGRVAMQASGVNVYERPFRRTASSLNRVELFIPYTSIEEIRYRDEVDA